MGRPERPVDPEAGAVQRLAHQLRELRAGCGGPSYRTMARRAHYSAATLAQAAGGERLPSLAVVQAYARACDADPGEWETRWKTAAEEDMAARQDGGGADEPPYRGLVRFEPGDEELFFGRERLVGELLELVCEHRLAMVVGASGSGKSSLLRAGLIPRLRRRVEQDGCAAVLRVLTPGATPAATHGHLLAPGDGEPDSWVVVDQFEEIFTLCRDREERARFVELLLAARERRSRLRVVIAVRADFYARCAEHRGLVDALREAHLLVGPMDATELREAVVRPAAAAGLLVERELTARIIDEVVDRPGALPMLSHALLETWHRRRGRTLTMAAYEAAGGVCGAIAATAEHLYDSLSPAQARTARRVLLRLVEPGQGTTDTRRPVRRDELDASDPELREVVERLARARLLTVDAEGMELAHEALINSWPRLHSWVEEDRERLRQHRSLTQAARTWEELGRDTGTLYRGNRLAHAEEMFAAGLSLELNTLEREFLTAAFDARAHEHRSATRTARRARRLILSLSVAVALSLVTGLVAWQLHRNGVRERVETAARRVASVAGSMRATDPRTAMLLSVAAWRTAPLTESRSALLGALTQPQLDAFTAPGSDGDTPRFLADSGRTVLSTEGRTWGTWDVASHRRIASGPLPGAATVLGAGPDARVVAVQVPGGKRLLDTVTGKWTGPARALPSSYRIGFGPSGRSYVVRDPHRGRTWLRAVAGDRVLYAASGAGGPDVAPSPDDRQVAVCAKGHAPAVWDLGRRRALHGAWEHTHGICDDAYELLRLGADHRLIALSSTGIRAWDTTSGRRLAGLFYPDVQYAAFSRDGEFLAASCRDEIRVWRLSAPDAPVFRYSLNGQLPSGSLAWDPDRPVLRYLEGATVHTLDVAAATTPRWRDRPLDNTLLDPSGRVLATAERTGDHYRFQLRATVNGRLLRQLRSPALPVARAGSEPVVPADTRSLMAFSPDGDTFAYGVSAPGRDTATQRLTLWDVARGRERGTVDLATAPSASASGPAVAVALGPGGRTLLAARTWSAPAAVVLPDLDDLPELTKLTGLAGTVPDTTGAPEVTDEVWDTTRQRRTAVLQDFDSGTLAVRPDGRLLVGNSHTVALPSGPVTAQALGQSGRIGALAFSGDGSRLAAGDLTGRVALWDGALRDRAGILPNVFPAPLTNTPEAVSALAFSPDGRTLAVAGDAGTVQLWDTATRQPLGGTLPTPGENIRSLAFSPDNSTLYVTGDHVPLQRYAVSAAAVLTQVCARAGTSLTRSAWAADIPDAPYQNTCEQR
ncbi:PD40 domain-containing protein [Streptomyces sp. MBT53]|uniref:nSTAND1 domain-containing NTPase n=1 Tax=Streptomyces sp. MBT53 TaxID=1488384 RepID=UPI0019115126|nr:PD40 domain-containing protein [Streptomyces sp. MBT53]MBK6017458.1 PD40 domain-containing protein [Streptomyces sp. MBT53]